MSDKREDPVDGVQVDGSNPEAALAQLGIGTEDKVPSKDKIQKVIAEREEEAQVAAEAITAKDLIGAVTARATVPYWVRIPGQTPIEVQIKPVSLTTFFTIMRDYRLQAEVAGDKSTADAREAVAWIVAGTAKPELQLSDMADLLDGHPVVLLDWSQQIRRVSGESAVIDWDVKGEQISTALMGSVTAVVEEGILAVVKERVKNPAFITDMNLAWAQAQDMVRGTVQQAVIAAQQLGEDKFCDRAGVSVPKGEIKND